MRAVSASAAAAAASRKKLSTTSATACSSTCAWQADTVCCVATRVGETYSIPKAKLQSSAALAAPPPHHKVKLKSTSFWFPKTGQLHNRMRPPFADGAMHTILSVTTPL